MLSQESFALYAQWSLIATVGFALLALVAFRLGWGFRFRLVGVTGFMGVLTFGLFALSLTPLTRVSIPGAARYTLVYDTGAQQTVIAVAPEITPEELTATLEQAASDLFSSGRLGRNGNQLLIRARTLIHPEAGLSEPVFLGQATRSLTDRSDPQMRIQVFPEAFDRLPKA
ncbi:Ycf51 family protein [Lyngbya confervoides]|uniref:Ycf51 family protein n=1 Tax=Lyngbya confervoides BDU141951 TaxID=1574623 RepID=A0ABD4T8U3_9CYAN|nr:Ycf51 family protein [Lyngbya confervoides]MCM1985217.1 Ycf51 family protein [Lyngbya confervoides BDU141951]